MPKVTEYQAETVARGMPGTRNATGEDFGPGKFGHAISDATDSLYKSKVQDDVTNVRVNMAKTRADLDVQFRTESANAEPGDPTFADKFTTKAREILDKGAENVRTAEGRRAYDELRAGLDGHFTEKAGLFEVQSAGLKAKQNWETSMNAYGTSLQTDPTQYATIRDQALSEIQDPNGQYGRIPAADRGKLVIAARDHLAQAYVQGLIDNGAADLARKKLMDGQLDDQLNAKDKQRLVKEADVGIRAKDVAAERERLFAERAQKDAQRADMDKYLARIVDPVPNGGAPSDREIITNRTLDAAQKEHLVEYKMRRARELAAFAETKTNPTEVRRLMLDIHAADDDPRKTYNADGVMESYKNGKISTAEMRLLRGEVEQLRNGSTTNFQKDLQNARESVRTAITRSILGQTQPEVAADAAYRFSRDLEAAVEAKRKGSPDSPGGNDPRTLLTPGHKDYMLTPERVSSYLTPPKKAVAAEADKIRATEPGTAPALPTTLRTATNPATGEKLIFRDGKWQKP